MSDKPGRQASQTLKQTSNTHRNDLNFSLLRPLNKMFK
jgi:hypothetical protein